MIVSESDKIVSESDEVVSESVNFEKTNYIWHLLHIHLVYLFSHMHSFSNFCTQANKTETQTRPIPERPRYGQPPFAGEIQNQNEAGDERLNRDILERRSSPANQPPRSPKKPANPEWLQVPMNDGERPAELGTPLVKDKLLYL